MARKKGVTEDDVRRIVLALPETGEEADRFAFYVRNGGKEKAIAWVWLERGEDGKRVPNPDVLAVRVDGKGAKEMLLAANPDAFFTEPHYNNFPAILVRLAVVGSDELEELLTDAWLVQAPRALAKSFTAASTRP